MALTVNSGGIASASHGEDEEEEEDSGGVNRDAKRPVT